MDRLERHHQLHRRAVRVGDDALVGVERLRVDLGDDERDLGVAPEARGVVDDDAPAATKRGAHSREVVAPAEKSARSKPWIVSSLSGWTTSPPVELAAGRALGGEGDDLARGEVALAQLREHHGADRAGGADDGDAQAHGLNGCSARTSSAPSSKASCSARTACGDLLAAHDAGDLDRRGGDHLDVDALAAEGGEHLGGDAGVRLHSRADDRDLAHRRVLGDAGDADVGDDRVERGAGGRQVGARDGEGHVGRGALGLRLVLDDHVDVDVGVGERREDPPGDARAVRDAEQRDARLVGRVGDGGDERVVPWSPPRRRRRYRAPR